MILSDPSHDVMVYDVPPDSPASENPWFDRFYFDLHAPAGQPFVVVGAAVYPGLGLADGYVVAVTDKEQRNLRVSDQFAPGAPRSQVCALSWKVVEPLRQWRLKVGPNPTGVELDVLWTARTPAWGVHPIRIDTLAEAGTTDFNHLFQSGRYAGTITIDGTAIDVGGWVGQRDRSRGLRRARDRLGMHLWIAAQMQDYSIGCNFNLDRQNRLSHCDGALLHENGSACAIRGLRHRMDVDEVDVLLDGEVLIDVEDSTPVSLTFERTATGLFMAGGGYGGWHGIPRGPNHIEHERWPHDGSRNPRTLALGLQQTPSRFKSGEEIGHGLVELALSRSSFYSYRSDLA